MATSTWAVIQPPLAEAQKTRPGKGQAKHHAPTPAEQKKTTALSAVVGILATRYSVLNDLLEKAFGKYEDRTHSDDDLMPKGRPVARLIYLSMVYSTPPSDEDSRALHKAANELLDQIRIVEAALKSKKADTSSDPILQQTLQIAQEQLSLARGLAPVVIQTSSDWTVVIGNSPGSPVFWHVVGRHSKDSGQFEFRVHRADVIHKTSAGLTLPMIAYYRTYQSAETPRTGAEPANTHETKYVVLRPKEQGDDRYVLPTMDDMQAFLRSFDVAATAGGLFKEETPPGTQTLDAASLAAALRPEGTNGITPDKPVKVAVKPAETSPPAPKLTPAPELDWVVEGIVDAIYSAINDLCGGRLSDPAGGREQVDEWVNAHVKPYTADLKRRAQIVIGIQQALGRKGLEQRYADFQKEMAPQKPGTPGEEQRALDFVLRVISEAVKGITTPSASFPVAAPAPKSDLTVKPDLPPQPPPPSVPPKKSPHAKPDPAIEKAKGTIKTNAAKITEWTKTMTKRPPSEEELKDAEAAISEAHKTLAASAEPDTISHRDRADALLRTAAFLEEILRIKTELQTPLASDSPLLSLDIGLTRETRLKLFKGGLLLAGGVNADPATLKLLSQAFATLSSDVTKNQTLAEELGKKLGDKSFGEQPQDLKEGAMRVKEQMAGIASSFKTLIPDDLDDVLDMTTRRPTRIDWSDHENLADKVYRVDSESEGQYKRPTMAGIWVRPAGGTNQSPSIAVIIVKDKEDPFAKDGKVDRTIEWQLLYADNSSPLHFLGIGSFHKDELLGGYYQALYNFADGKDPNGKPLPISQGGPPQNLPVPPAKTKSSTDGRKSKLDGAA